MIEEVRDRFRAYCAVSEIAIGRELGWGVLGIVYDVIRQGEPAALALRMYRHPQFFEKELRVYRHLAECSVSSVMGCTVPQLIDSDRERHALFMSIVKPPFLLDFAGADLGNGPEFSDEIWEDW